MAVSTTGAASARITSLATCGTEFLVDAIKLPVHLITVPITANYKLYLQLIRYIISKTVTVDDQVWALDEAGSILKLDCSPVLSACGLETSDDDLNRTDEDWVLL